MQRHLARFSLGLQQSYGIQSSTLAGARGSLSNGLSWAASSSDCSTASTSSRCTSSSAQVDWDWAFVVGEKRGRKPAIKKPQRHQWHFCNPNYDPAERLPKSILPPHAPPSAAAINDWARYRAGMPNSETRKYRRNFIRFRSLRDLDWRDAFQQGLAQHVKEAKKAQKLENEQRRQHAWRQYKEGLFAKALDGK